jgi:hypothetical protein
MTTRPGYVWDATASEWVEIGQAAVVAPIAYQTSEPVSPATGDIWIDSDDEVPSVDSTLYYRWTKTMSGGETSLSGTDDNSLALEYTPGYESVFINGVLQVRGLDYVATDGTTVTGLTALTASDVVMVESIIAYSVGDTYTQTQIGSLLDAKSPVSTTGLVLITSATIGSAVSSVVVTNAFSTTYESYKILITGGVGSADTELQLQMGATATGYYEARFGANYTGTTAGPFCTANGSKWTDVGTARSTNGIDANIEISSPFTAKNTYFSARRVSTNNAYQVLGYLANTTSYTDFTINPISGTLTGGTIKVYGYK